MLLRLIYDERLAHAAWLVGCQRTGEAIVIDPARDVDRYVALAQAEGLRIVATADTHVHADYLTGSRELAELGARIHVSDEGGPDWHCAWCDAYDHKRLKDGDAFAIGNIEFRTLHTPGHTPEHVCFLLTDRGGGATEPMGIFSGDFVFVGDMGRPDLLETAAGVVGTKESGARDLARSAARFAQLPDFLQVWPAHGAGSACGKALGAIPSSTVGYEKRFNGALRLAADESAFVASILADQPSPPLYFGRMKAENRDGPALLGAVPRPARTEIKEIRDDRNDVVLDLRPWESFRAGHLGGALHCPLVAAFPTVAGSYVEPERTIWLVAEESRVEEAVRELVRVGLDRIAGFVEPWDVEAHGGLETTDEIPVAALRERLGRADAFVLDVRQPWEHAAGAIAGSVNVPHVRLAAELDRIPRDRPIHVHCRSGVRSSYATALLERAGYHAVNVAGGFMAWERAGFETTTPVPA